MTNYPPGTIGCELDELSQRVANLPWWLWFQKQFLRYRIARAKRIMVKLRASFVHLEEKR